MKRLGILTGGGDAAGMNAAVRAVARTAMNQNIEVVGIHRGWLGLSEGDYSTMTRRDTGGILHKGGTILRTFRYPEFKKEIGQKAVAEQLPKMNLDGLVIIGGDGSFRGGTLLQDKFGIPVIGIPATIDNDIQDTDISIGFDTALNIAVDAVDKIRDTASSHGRIFVIEVMGRHCGLLAAHTALACGAEEMIVPEIDWDLDLICARIKSGYDRGKDHSIIVVAEGAAKASQIEPEIRSKLNRGVRMVVLGHVQRGGEPTAYDRNLATKLGTAAAKMIINGESGFMIGMQANEIHKSPLMKTGGAVREEIQIIDKLLHELI